MRRWWRWVRRRSPQIRWGESDYQRRLANLRYRVDQAKNSRGQAQADVMADVLNDLVAIAAQLRPSRSLRLSWPGFPLDEEDREALRDQLVSWGVRGIIYTVAILWAAWLIGTAARVLISAYGGGLW